MHVPFNTKTLNLSARKEAAVRGAMMVAVSRLRVAGLTEQEIALAVMSYGTSLVARIYGATRTGEALQQHGREVVSENPLH